MRISLLVVAMAFVLGGCSNTWEGVKDDSSKVWNDSKEAVHDATE